MAKRVRGKSRVVLGARAGSDGRAACAQSRGKKDKRLSWEETYRQTAREKEDWSDLDATAADGIEAGEKPAIAMLLRRLITETYGE